MSRWFRRIPRGFRNGRFLTISWCGGASVPTLTEKKNSNPSTDHDAKPSDAKPKNPFHSYEKLTWAELLEMAMDDLIIPISFAAIGPLVGIQFESVTLNMPNIDPIVYSLVTGGVVLYLRWSDFYEEEEKMSEKNAILEGKVLVAETELKTLERVSKDQFKEYQKIMETEYNKYKQDYKQKVDKKSKTEFDTYKQKVDGEFEAYKEKIDQEFKKKQKEKDHYFVVAHDFHNSWQLHHFNNEDDALKKYDKFYVQSSKLLAQNNQVKYAYFASDGWKKIVQDMYIQYSSQFGMENHKLK